MYCIQWDTEVYVRYPVQWDTEVYVRYPVQWDTKVYVGYPVQWDTEVYIGYPVQWNTEVYNKVKIPTQMFCYIRTLLQPTPVLANTSPGQHCVHVLH